MNWLPDIFGRRAIRKLTNEVQALRFSFSLAFSQQRSQSVEKGAPANVVGWQADNVLELRAFLKTPTGQLLMQRARAMEYNRSIANANDVMHTQHSAGVTVGINGTLNWIESLASDQVLQNLSGPTADQVGKTDTASGDHDDAALVEKFSP